MSSNPIDTTSYFLTFDDSPAGNKQAEMVTQSSSFRLRFTRTLDELSEELDRWSKDTQNPQEEIENATREALRIFECTNSISSPGQNSPIDDSAAESTGCSAHQQAVTQAVVCCMDTLKQDEVQQDRGLCEKEENAIDNTLDQLSHLQLNKAHSEEQETFSPQRAIMNLQIKLHEAQMEEDVLTVPRLKDSRKLVSQMAKMLHLLEELQNVKRSADQKLQETEDEASALHREVESLEKCVKKIYHTLYEKQFGHNSTGNKTVKHQVPQSAYENLSKDTDKQHWTFFTSKDQQRNGEYKGLNKQESMEDLITSLGQKLAVLTDKLSSSKHSGVYLCNKFKRLKPLNQSFCVDTWLKRQTLLHHCQISELESTLSSYKDKQQLELSEDTEALRGQLELARKQLYKAGRGEILPTDAFRARVTGSKEISGTSAGKYKEFYFKEQHNQLCQALQAEQEAQLKLTDREKMADILRLEMESSIQKARHSDTITNLQQENSFLINQHKQEIQQLKVRQGNTNQTSLLMIIVLNSPTQVQLGVCVERERQQLQACLTSRQNQRLQEGELRRNSKLSNSWELQRPSIVAFVWLYVIAHSLDIIRVFVGTISEEHEELQRLHSCEKDEHEGVVLKLQSQLSSAHNEHDKIRHSLRTLRAADGHGLQMALDSAEEITAKREKVDSLQSRIQHLEEKVENLQQTDFFILFLSGKAPPEPEMHHQLQELTFVREEKRQLGSELRALRSNGPPARERISELEAVLHKELQDSICADFPNLLLPGPRQHPDKRRVLPSSKRCKQRFQTNHRPHTSKSAVSSSLHRRRSAPERQQTATFRAENKERAKACSRLMRKTCSSEPHLQEITEPDGQTVHHRDRPFTSNPVSAANYTTFLQMLSLGRRSPVHTLLTSNPNS
ncbi:LOW QUALITY PROTEIN: uncharacterized protein FYW61_016180 [Anableps anableps]